MRVTAIYPDIDPRKTAWAEIENGYLTSHGDAYSPYTQETRNHERMLFLLGEMVNDSDFIVIHYPDNKDAYRAIGAIIAGLNCGDGKIIKYYPKGYPGDKGKYVQKNFGFRTRERLEFAIFMASNLHNELVRRNKTKNKGDQNDPTCQGGQEGIARKISRTVL